MMDRAKEQNARNYLDKYSVDFFIEKNWPKDKPIKITDIGSGNLKQIATIITGLINNGYKVELVLMDPQFEILYLTTDKSTINGLPPKDQLKYREVSKKIEEFEVFLKILNDHAQMADAAILKGVFSSPDSYKATIQGKPLQYEYCETTAELRARLEEGVSRRYLSTVIKQDHYAEKNQVLQNEFDANEKCKMQTPDLILVIDDVTEFQAKLVGRLSADKPSADLEYAFVNEIITPFSKGDNPPAILFTQKYFKSSQVSALQIGIIDSKKPKNIVYEYQQRSADSSYEVTKVDQGQIPPLNRDELGTHDTAEQLRVRTLFGSTADASKMPSPLKDFIKMQLKAKSHEPGRFFTAYNGDFSVNDTDLMAKYDAILKSIGDGQPKPETVKELFTLVDSSLETIFNEIQQEDSSIILDEKQKANIKYSIIFKFPGYLFNTKTATANPEDLSVVTKEYKGLNRQSRVLTNLAQQYFLNKNTNIAANMEVFYKDECQKVMNYVKGGVSQVDGTKISNVSDLVNEMKLESNSNFKALPQIFKDQLSVDLYLWNLDLTAKANPYAISLIGFDDLVVSTLSNVPSTTVESMAQTMTERQNFTPEEIEWMKTTPVSDVVMGKDYADEHDSSMIYFNISAKNKEDPGLKLSSRASTHHEFRGEVLREMITEAQKAGSKQFVYDAFQGHIRTVKNNNDWHYMQNAISSQLLTESRSAGDVGFLQGFDSETPVYEAVKAQVIERLLMFASKYSEALANSSDLLDVESKLTAKGKAQCETILNEINAKNPLPAELVQLMQALKTIDTQLKKVKEQLNNGNPFEAGSQEHTALQTFHDHLDGALSSLKSKEPVEFPDGKRKYTINDFKIDCDTAVKEAENSALKHHRGWWATVLKPILIVVGVCCTLGAVLLSTSWRKSTYEGLYNISKETEGMKKITDFRGALKEIKDNPEHQRDEPKDEQSLKI
jgi:hypothetical protein